MNTPISKSINMRHLTLLFCLLCAFSLVQAQPFKKVYPTLTSVKKIPGNKGNKQISYRVKKAGITYQITVKRNSPTEVSYRIATQADGQIGSATGTISNGDCQEILINDTEEGLLDLWQFAVDRVVVRNGTYKMATNNAKLLACQEECRSKNLDVFIRGDNNGGEAFYNDTQVGDGDCDGYIPCSREVLNDYELCLCDCLSEGN
jgi:hypothetical protein